MWLSDVDDSGCALCKGEGFFCHSGCVMLMAQQVVMILAVRSSVIIIKRTLLLIMK